MKKEALCTIKNLSYSINHNKILDDINFTIHHNEVTTIIGYNGSGKSTLLKLLLGSIRPNSGKIIKKPNITIGYVPQKLSFNNRLPITVADFIEIYNTHNHQKPTIGCSFFSIKDLEQKKISELSGGQLQKVLIYNALIGDPDIVLLDEPTAGLDIQAQKDFYQLIEHVHNRHGISIVLISHDTHSVYSKSNQVICLHQGKCCKSLPSHKTTEEINSSFQDEYIRPYLHNHSQDNAR